VESLRLRIQKKDLLIRIEIDDEYAVIADEEMLNILLENLLINSIKFSNIGGTIKVSAEKKVDAENRKTDIQLSIADEGVGISEDNLLKIKSGIMYSTLGTAKESGLGLGLLISEKLIEIHGGKMEIKSSEGEGTKVILTFTDDGGQIT
jgi:signal transduction histidine kinase